MENYTKCANYVNSIIPHQTANLLSTLFLHKVLMKQFCLYSSSVCTIAVTESIETDQEDDITVEEVDLFTAMCYETMDEAAANVCAERPEMENEINGNILFISKIFSIVSPDLLTLFYS